jgi:hypothetical protein
MWINPSRPQKRAGMPMTPAYLALLELCLRALFAILKSHYLFDNFTVKPNRYSALKQRQHHAQRAPGCANDNACYENTAITRRQRALLAAQTPLDI